ncbi:nucleoside deaminase [Candidatus Pacearchaeota archaeon]|nr:nucleoside deaminase [Candidatus Pacearchaeota archaeon]
MKYKPKNKFMKLAIEEARRGNKEFGKYPMGAVIVKGDKVIAKSYNGLPNNDDPTAHAEILAMKKAAKKLKTRYLDDCVLYTTNEPCAMCSGETVWANMKGIVFGASVEDLENFWKKRRNEKTSTRRFIFVKAKEVVGEAKPKMFVIGKFMRKECLELMKLYDKDLKR